MIDKYVIHTMLSQGLFETRPMEVIAAVDFATLLRYLGKDFEVSKHNEEYGYWEDCTQEFKDFVLPVDRYKNNFI